MSNCVTLRHEEVIFEKDFFKPGFVKLVQEATEPDKEYYNKDHHSDEEIDNYIAWWFLKDNTFELEDGRVEIAFGRGRSGHTWRDLRSTIWMLNRWTRDHKELIHRFIGEDESERGYWFPFYGIFKHGADQEIEYPSN